MSQPKTICCPEMEYHLGWRCDEHTDPNDCPDCVVRFYSIQIGYGIPIHDGGSSFIRIEYCPWCGAKLADFLTPQLG